jgi:hypothetical protein
MRVNVGITQDIIIEVPRSQGISCRLRHEYSLSLNWEIKSLTFLCGIPSKPNQKLPRIISNLLQQTSTSFIYIDMSRAQDPPNVVEARHLTFCW